MNGLSLVPRDLVSTARAMPAILGTSVKATLALRRSFWLQAVLMFINNAAFFVFWVLFFHRFDEVRGWRLEDTAALYGIVAFGWGFGVILFGGVPRLARSILDGELDPLLVQPKSVLLQAITVRSGASGWGDLGTGAILIGIVAAGDPALIPLALAGSVASAAVFTATGVILHSSAFWLSRIEVLAGQLHEFQLTFSLYPANLFGGGIRLILYTAIPAGFAGYLPVDLVRSPDPAAAVLLIAGVIAYILAAVTLFDLGLRFYTSGNRVGGVW